MTGIAGNPQEVHSGRQSAAVNGKIDYIALLDCASEQVGKRVFPGYIRKRFIRKINV